MHTRVRNLLVFASGLSLLFVLAGESAAAVRPATEADRAWMEAAGIPYTPGMLVDPDNPYAGSEAGDVKQWLRQHATKGSNISCLDPQFAQKLKTFMEAVPGGPPTIISAYRPPESQNALVASGASRAGPCQSYHNYGLAADFNNGRQISWMRQNSKRYGINIIGAWDPNHFQDARGRFGQCGACSNYRGDGTQAEPPGGGGAPSAGLSDAVRASVSPQPAPAGAPQQVPPAQTQPQSSSQPPLNGQNTTASAPGTCAPQYYCASNNLYYRSSTCTDQLTQTCQNGCSGVACISSPQGGGTGVSSLLGSSTKELPPAPPPPASSTTPHATTSAFDQIGAFANPTAAPVGTAATSSFVLSLTPGDQQRLESPESGPPKTVYTEQPRSPGSYAASQSQQTFTSSGLGYGAAAPDTTPRYSGFSAALESMRSVIAGMLIYLQPFQGTIPGRYSNTGGLE